MKKLLYGLAFALILSAFGLLLHDVLFNHSKNVWCNPTNSRCAEDRK